MDIDRIEVDIDKYEDLLYDVFMNESLSKFTKFKITDENESFKSYNSNQSYSNDTTKKNSKSSYSNTTKSYNSYNSYKSNNFKKNATGENCKNYKDHKYSENLNKRSKEQPGYDDKDDKYIKKRNRGSSFDQDDRDFQKRTHNNFNFFEGVTKTTSNLTKVASRDHLSHDYNDFNVRDMRNERNDRNERNGREKQNKSTNSDEEEGGVENESYEVKTISHTNINIVQSQSSTKEMNQQVQQIESNSTKGLNLNKGMNDIHDPMRKIFEGSHSQDLIKTQQNNVGLTFSKTKDFVSLPKVPSKTEYKINLVLDLDHTLIHACDKFTLQQQNYKSTNNDSLEFILPTFNFREKDYNWQVKIRYELKAFLQFTSQFCDIYIYTHGCGPYALKALKLINDLSI